MAAARKPIIAGNWKMNNTLVESVDLAQGISYQIDRKFDECEVVLCPPFTALRSVWNVIEFDNSPMVVAAQDVYPVDSGAYTGCISPVMVKDIGCTYCIIGHSERRGYFNETDADINAKAKALIAHGVKPIMCCGESLECRDSGEALAFVTGQIRAGLDGIDAKDVASSVIAYEPIWAIGTGRTATPEQAQEMCAAIRETVADMFGDETAQAVRILYGGSMKPANVELFMPEPDIDGGLIGGASLKVDDFISLVNSAAKFA